MADTDISLDDEIQLMRQKVAELRKRRELLQLKAQFEEENRLYEEAQRDLDNARAPDTTSLCQDPQTHVLSTQAAGTQTRTPSKPAMTSPNGVGLGLLSPQHTREGGFTIKGSAQTYAVDQFMNSLQDGIEKGEPERPKPQSEEGVHKGRSNSQSGPATVPGTVPIERPGTSGQRPHSQMQLHTQPSGAVAEEVSLTVQSQSTGSTGAESLGSESMSGTDDEESDSEEQIDESSPRQIPPNTPKGPARAFSGPVSPRDTGNATAGPKMPLYKANSLDECVRLVEGLESYFLRYPNAFKTDFQKVQLGETYLCAELNPRWEARRRNMRRQSWVAFCLFLADLLSDLQGADHARILYSKANQGEDRLLPFVLYVETLARHFNSAHHDRLRHLSDRINPRLKGLAGRSYRDFDEYHEWVECLLGAEQRLEERIEGRIENRIELAGSKRSMGLRSGPPPPRKRSRAR